MTDSGTASNPSTNSTERLTRLTHQRNLIKQDLDRVEAAKLRLAEALGTAVENLRIHELITGGEDRRLTRSREAVITEVATSKKLIHRIHATVIRRWEEENTKTQGIKPFWRKR